ncbi:MAG TPA: YggT family protein [Candidatus Acidoferrales bacterium]|nr:YggT family protein [Candidatus Acidoferrales bacterium]
MHERPAYAPANASTNVNASTTGGSTVTPVWSVTSVVTLIFTVLEVLLLLRFIFKLAGANANQALVAGLYRLTEPLTRPFQGIFPEPQAPLALDIPALLAIVFLFLIGALIVALVRAIMAPRRA